VHLSGAPPLIAERMTSRSAHFMPQSLIESQFGDLEALQTDELDVVCDIQQSLETIRDRVAERLDSASTVHAR
jgi:gluconokinase